MAWGVLMKFVDDGVVSSWCPSCVFLVNLTTILTF
eukprot:CCRYP_002475-RB/>CCRYP_002475-RB protein AED:0.44 eAED:0.44 QI:101/1/1/1/0/0/2/29/34